MKKVDQAAVFAFNCYRENCKRGNKYWGLTREDVAQFIHERCHYCGAPPANILTNRQSPESRTLRYQGIDRMDNRQGYLLKNCVPCCGVCNSIKGSTLTYREMKAAMKAILRVRKKYPTRRKRRLRR